MPKETFRNLPEEKKQTLIESLQKEFSRVPLYQASVSNIIKTAKIPRGSFYQYFEDIEDAYFYLLNRLLFQVREKFLFMLEENKGDLFSAMLVFFQEITKEDDNFQFFRNSLLNMNHKIEKSMSGVFANEHSMEQFEKLQSKIDKSKLNIKETNDLLHIMKIVSAITFHNLIDQFSKGLSNEEAINNYTKQLNMVKTGLILK